VKKQAPKTRELIKSVRFSKDDWPAIEAAAARAGLDAATYIRSVVIKAARKDNGG